MLKFLSTLSLLASILYLYVGIYTYKLNKNSPVCKIFLLLNSAMSIWSFAYSFAYTAQNAISFSFWNKISALGWCSFSALTLYLVLAIAESKLLNYLFIKILILLPAPIFLLTAVFLFGSDIETHKTVALFFYKGNFIYNFSYLLLSIIVIYFWGKNSDSSSQKTQAKIIVITSLLPFLLNLITQTVLPSLGIIRIIPNMGQIYSLIMLWGVYYVIVNYRFMQIPTSLITKELFSEMIDLAFLVDLKGNIIEINKQVDHLLAYDEKELLNTSISLIIKEKDIVSLLNDGEHLTETARFNDVPIASKLGNIIPFNVSITPLRDSKTHILLGMLIVSQDIRSIKALQNEIVQHTLTSENLKQSNEEIERVNNELLSINKMLKQKAIRDGLTNLYNHQHINELLEEEIQKAITYKHGLCLMMLDIDLFKRVNDNFGHQVGDKVLVTVSQLIELSTRNIDLLGRYGGEEFIVVLPIINLNDAYAIAEQIRLSIQNFDFKIDGLKVTLSIGLSEFHLEDSKSLVNKADNLLYRAKDNGRNRIEV